MDEGWFVRDLAVTAVVFGTAAFVWFGWGQEDPPARWRAWLGAGSGLGLLVALVGGFLTWQNWGPDSVFAVAQTRRAFGVVCGIEFGLAGLGAAVFGVRRRPRWIAPWIAFVVGAHFVPLAWIFRDPGLVVLAVLVCAAAVAAVVLRGRFTPSAVTGVGAGTALLVFGARAALLVV
ncbi:DUF7010 family protein [Pseudonocardia abyssalis]|jgi:hypothetical protein|uniref:Tripartite tricarboxylate transporter TctB family protein n=1 Tax=Pseudonocardia abyssalis TaxID=2792008 RepID=A0ABS6UKQ2_9PSEU|nr:hypothetical protein [Pseudonocardia abyssalis]MBW0117383.1 hypothetical protein [Pseudonocardia abyssalis]MBW0132795.1 hypothetical protein [Pseudonocardia abyssalis]